MNGICILMEIREHGTYMFWFMFNHINHTIVQGPVILHFMEELVDEFVRQRDALPPFLWNLRSAGYNHF